MKRLKAFTGAQHVTVLGLAHVTKNTSHCTSTTTLFCIMTGLPTLHKVNPLHLMFVASEYDLLYICSLKSYNQKLNKSPSPFCTCIVGCTVPSPWP